MTPVPRPCLSIRSHPPPAPPRFDYPLPPCLQECLPGITCHVAAPAHAKASDSPSSAASGHIWLATLALLTALYPELPSPRQGLGQGQGLPALLQAGVQLAAAPAAPSLPQQQRQHHQPEKQPKPPSYTAGAAAPRPAAHSPTRRHHSLATQPGPEAGAAPPAAAAPAAAPAGEAAAAAVMAAAAVAAGGEELLLEAHLSDKGKRLAVGLARRGLALVMQAVREQLSRTHGGNLHPARQHMLQVAVLVALHELSGRQVSVVLGRKRSLQQEQAQQQQQHHAHHHPCNHQQQAQPSHPPRPPPQQHDPHHACNHQKLAQPPPPPPQHQLLRQEQPALQLPAAPAWQQDGGTGAVAGSWQPAEVIQQPADDSWQPADVTCRPADGRWSPTAAAPPGSGELPPSLQGGAGGQGATCPRQGGGGGQVGAYQVQGGGSGAEDPLTLLQALLEQAGLVDGGTQLLQLPPAQPPAKRHKADS